MIDKNGIRDACSTADQVPAFQGISFRDGTGFLQNPGIPGFSGTGFASYFYPGIFWKLFGIFLFDAIGDQFKHFSRAGKPNKHFFPSEKQTS